MVSLIEIGACIQGLWVADRFGTLRDVVLGYDTAAEYEANPTFFGAALGRLISRMPDCTLHFEGRDYPLDNIDDMHMHGGVKGFSRVKWDGEILGEHQVRFRYVSPDGEEGYPGEVTAVITYSLDDTGLTIDYSMSADSRTVVNPSNHSYFNLAGHDAGSIENQTLVLKAEQFSPVIDSASIPTGEHAPVQGTPMDFTSEKAIGAEIEADFEQLKLTGGYDHNFILDKAVEGSIELMAVASCKESGITMEAFTDLPCVQFYAGNFIAPVTGKNGVFYDKRNGFCLESQYVPNAINQEGEEKPILEAGDTYDTTTVYKFIF